ncbi:MAG: alpha-ketoglutarate-dependent dioxygenase AlkB [Rhizobiaceae bacterium]|nr:alpha-ketoglutarate-dependent dioxygenase AlkB [Rhizobiaceae bacterium]MBL4696904.1 alpha-ketoglutarate-dependent dioxygenase AlkB [Rhizobiaceae bacterium]
MQKLPDGTLLFPDFLKKQEQEQLVASVRDVVKRAPLFISTMPKTGKPMSVRMTNCGTLGWLSDKENGYRYQAHHPQTGNAWPPIPDQLLAIWDELSGYAHSPQACLINYYGTDAKMGLHQDRDEQNFDAPVLSVSLGDSALFRVGGENRTDKTTSFKLNSGDVMMLSGKSRLAFHGISRIYPGTSMLLKQGGRINLTLRRVTEL